MNNYIPPRSRITALTLCQNPHTYEAIALFSLNNITEKSRIGYHIKMMLFNRESLFSGHS